MVTATQPKKPASTPRSKATAKSPANGATQKRATLNNVIKPRPQRKAASKRARYLANVPDVPTWLSTVISVVGVGVAVGAGLYATRHQWMSKADEWRDNFSAAFADDETDYENFDQTRHAGKDSMRDDPGEDWEDVDDMSDASFPASDPPSFNPGTA